MRIRGLAGAFACLVAAAAAQGQAQVDATATVMGIQATTASACSPAPSACRLPIEAGKSRLLLKDNGDKDKLVWLWKKGAATTKAEFADPVAGDEYHFCLYHDGVLVREFALPGGVCAGKPCWKEVGKGYTYKDKELTPDGILVAKLLEGAAGDAKLTVKGKSAALSLPPLGGLTEVIEVQLQREGGPCWGARYTPPFAKAQANFVKAVSDDPSASVAPVWSAIHTEIVAGCAGCHGGGGGLGGLSDCNTGYANLVGVPSTELPTMYRVEPGDSTLSWLMHKLDGTHVNFTAECVGNFCGGRMPLGGFLTEVQLDAVRNWINNGAVNDCP